MKRKINLTKVLAKLRRLPPEVSYAQVEQWVVQHSSKPIKPSSYLGTWLAKWKNWN